MADFSIIADVSAALIKQLRESLCPEQVQTVEAIQLASPNSKNADFQVGVFLYDIREAGELRRSAPIRGADDRLRFPPRPLNLFYFVYLNSKAQIAAGAEMEQRILGKTIQTLADRAVLNVAEAHLFPEEPEENAGITLLNLSFDEKSKIWSALSQPISLAIYFSISPILLSSRRESEVSRVTSAQFQTEHLHRRDTLPSVIVEESP